MSLTKALFFLGTFLAVLFAENRACAAADEAAKLHVILVGNTKDRNIGESVEKDLKNMESTLRAGFADANEKRLEITVLKGADFTLKNVRDAIKNLKTDGTATVMLYYAGHGIYLPGVGHTFAMDHPADQKYANELLRSDLRHMLLEKRARLAILLTDTCNSYPQGVELRPVPGAPEWETIRNLFLLPHGLVDINSVTEGESAFGDPLNGGCFTSTFAALLREKFSSLDVDKDKFLHWQELLPRLQAGAQDKFERIRRGELAQLTDDNIKNHPAAEQKSLREYRDDLRKQQYHSVRVYSLPPLARFGVRALNNEGSGVKVLVVYEFTPAALAGLKPGDVISQIGNMPIKNLADFQKAVDQAQGDVAVEFQRGTSVRKADVKVAPWPVPGQDS